MGPASNATAAWVAQQDVNLQSSTLRADETGELFHVQQTKQIRLYREAWKTAGHDWTPRVSVSRSIFALMDDRDGAYFERGDGSDQTGVIDDMRAIFGDPMRPSRKSWSSNCGPTRRLPLLTVPKRLGVDYNTHVLDAVPPHVAPALGWR